MALPPGSAFKTKCPSCEAGVTIKDPSLIGKKVECPKCKFRFVVEAPADAPAPAATGPKTPKAAAGAKPAAGAEAAKPGAVKSSRNKPLPKKADDDEGEKKKKKSKEKSGNTVLYVGGGLAALTLVVLGLYMAGIFDSEDGSGTPAPSKPQASNVPGKKIDTVTEPGKKEEPKVDVVGKKEPPKVPPVDLVAADITNMLPEDSEWVMRASGAEVLKTPVGSVLFDDAAESAKAFHRWMGFNGSDVEKLAFGGTNAGSIFGVIRLKKDVTFEEMQAAMEVDPLPVKVGRRACYIIKSNELFKMLGEYLRLKAQAVGLSLPPMKNAPLAFALPDPRTLIIADQPALEAFLRADLKRKHQTKYISPDQTPKKAAPKKGDGEPKVEENPPKKDDTGEPTPKKDDGTAKKQEAAFTTDPSFLSVDPALKIMMYQLDEGKPAVLSLAGRVPSDTLVRQTGGINPVAIPKTPVVGFVVRRMDELKLDVLAAVEFNRSDDAIRTALSLQATLAQAAKALSEVFRVPIVGGSDLKTNPMPMMGEANAMEDSPLARRLIDAFQTGSAPAATPRGLIPAFQEGRPQVGGEGGTDPKDPAVVPTSTLTATASDRFLMIRLQVDWGPSYYNHVSPNLRSAMDLLKGEALMMTGRAHWQTLAVSIEAMGKTGTTPPAAFPRPDDPDRFRLPYPPEQRVSWMADLLPSLGYQSVSWAVKREEAWNSPENLMAGSAWIPEFLTRDTPPSTWRAFVPSLKGRELGATHFVGMAGVGMDAASLPDTPEFKNRLGMLGYDRRTKFADVSDGLSNTILMAQVPPDLQRAWIRGGGSTVQGVPTTGSIKPFVSATWNGKKGTNVLMADGSIRFVTEGISDPLFQAMTTYKAGDKVDGMDAAAPLMKGEGKLVGGGKE